MKKILTIAAALACLVMPAGALMAQTTTLNSDFILTVTGQGGLSYTYDQALPCQIQGSDDGAAVTVDNCYDLVWGYDSVGNDSILCDTVLNDYTGKMVLIRRGVCNFSVKVNYAIAAGAAGVIIMNHNLNATETDCFTLDVALGGPVSVPVIFACRVVAAEISALVAAGPVQACFQTAPFGPRDVKLVDPFYTPLSVQTPESQIDTDTFGFGVSVFNSGESEIANNVRVVAEIQTQAGVVLYSDTVDIAAIAVGDTVNTRDITTDAFPLFVPNALTVDDYNMVYKVFADGVDARPVDNETALPFYVTDTLFAKEDGFIQASRPGTLPDAWHWGNIYTMASGVLDTFVAPYVQFTYACNPAPDPQPNEIRADVRIYRVNDDILPDFSNFNPMNFPPESGMTLVGFGEFIAPSNATNYQLHNVEMFDFNDPNLAPTVPLDAGARYFVVVSYSTPYNTAFQAYGNIATLPGTSQLLYSSQWFGGFTGDPDPLIRMVIRLKSVVDVTALPESSMRIMPNPVSSTLSLQFDLQNPTMTTVTLADMEGRVITTNDYPALQNDLLQFNVSNLPAGTYLARLATAEGTLTKKFVVVK